MPAQVLRQSKTEGECNLELSWASFHLALRLEHGQSQVNFQRDQGLDPANVMTLIVMVAQSTLVAYYHVIAQMSITAF